MLRLVIFPPCARHSLGGLLGAQTLTVHGDSGRAGDARWQTLRDGDFPVVIQEHEFSLIFVSSVFMVSFSGAAGWLPLHLPKWEPYSQTI